MSPPLWIPLSLSGVSLVGSCWSGIRTIRTVRMYEKRFTLSADEVDELIAALSTQPPIATETRRRWIARFKAWRPE